MGEDGWRSGFIDRWRDDYKNIKKGGWTGMVGRMNGKVVDGGMGGGMVDGWKWVE